jgi:hypothetical protein
MLTSFIENSFLPGKPSIIPAHKPIKTSGFSGNRKPDIFRKKVHETLQVQGTIGELKNKLLHYSVTDYDSYKKK